MTENLAPITVAVAGASGKMGQEAVSALLASPEFQVAGALVRHKAGTPPALTTSSISVYTDPEQLLLEAKPQVWLDFTDATSVTKNVDLALHYGVRPVIGATGYSLEDINRWREVCDRTRLGAIAAPNFAIGALLMIKFAKEAAQFYQQAEIIELHHDGKKDAPSGTAKKTAEAITHAFLDAQKLVSSDLSQTGQAAERLVPVNEDRVRETPVEITSRGLRVGEIPVHSIRLPGLVAHQEVLFGGHGETLTIRHDSMARSSFMPGVLLACSKVKELTGLVYGLENLLW